MSGIFISYRQQDAKAWAILLCKELAGVFGDDRVFLDKDTLHAGNWRAQILEALGKSGVVLVVIGRRWLTITDDSGRQRLNCPEDVHRQEIAFALSHKGVTVIPVLVDGAAMPRAEDLPMDIRSLTEHQSRELSDGRARRDVDMQLLTQDIQRITGLEREPEVQTSLENVSTGASLKTSLRTVLVISVLSLASWVFFYIFFPGTPLTAAETIVVLAICALLVFSGKRIWVRLHNRGATF